MKEAFEHNPEKYLERTKKRADTEYPPEKKGGVDPEIEDLKAHFADVSWEKLKGTVTFDLPSEEGSAPSKCIIEYNSILDENILNHFSDSSDPDGGLESIPDLPNYRRITNLTFQNSKGEIVNLKDICEEVSVYVYTGAMPDTKMRGKTKIGESKELGGFFNGGTHIIMVGSSPISKRGISYLLHEMGHAKRDRDMTMDAQDRADTVRGKMVEEKPLKAIERASIINDERYADAFALNIMRKFFSRKFMKEINKQSYRSQSKYHDALGKCESNDGVWQRFLGETI
ncbi:MAG: hypothetical protein PHS53_03615 [Candidatus Pacebacteria bacterium]|nr:hypothetical protein [Candidatus Paceibacterota bacterium]MDD5357205.1 hypothetical protein [Candidatus Paceibacterota bacterium]